MVRAVAVAGILLASFAQAEDAAARQAREELERELKQMVGTSPTRVRIDFVSPDEPNYKLLEATFEVDGQAVKGLPLAMLSGEVTRTVYEGEVTPGKHTVSAHVTYESQASAVVSDEGGYKWKLGGDTTFEVGSGLEVRVKVTPIRDSTQKDIAKRFALRMPAAPVMVATLDDGKMPEKMAKPAVVAVAAAEKPAPEKPAAEPMPRSPTKAPEPARLPIAAVPKGPARTPATATPATATPAPATPAPATPATPTTATPTTATPTTAEAVAQASGAEPHPPPRATEVGAVPPAAVVVAASPDVAARVSPEDGEGPRPWVWLVGGGVVVAVIFVVALARRRGRGA